jgi:cytochrome P450 family 6
MFPNVIRNADRMIDYLMPFAERVEPLEIKEVYGSYSTEVIADVAFGLKIDCLGNPENDFRKMGEIVFKPTILENLKLFFLISFSELAHKLKVGYTNRKVIDFFSKTVRETLEYREKNNLKRNDFFQMLMNIREKEGMSFTDMAANSFVFFLAG